MVYKMKHLKDHREWTLNNFSQIHKYLKSSGIDQMALNIQQVQKVQINKSAKSKRYYTDSVRCPIGVIDYLQKRLVCSTTTVLRQKYDV